MRPKQNKATTVADWRRYISFYGELDDYRDLSVLARTPGRKQIPATEALVPRRDIISAALIVPLSSKREFPGRILLRKLFE